MDEAADTHQPEPVTVAADPVDAPAEHVREEGNDVREDGASERGEGNDDARSTSSVETRKPETKRPKRPINSGVRYYNYHGFVNRVMDDNWDYTIEVLVAKPDWSEDVFDERARREAIVEPEAQEVPGRTTAAQMSSSSEKLGENRKLHRVRVRSPTVLEHLSKIADWGGDLAEATDELVFCRPFRAFEYFHEDMKKKLAEMEAAQSAAAAEAPKAPEAVMVASDAVGSEAEAVPATDEDATGLAAPAESVKADESVKTDESELTKATQTDSPSLDAADKTDEKQADEEPAPPRPTPLEDMRVYVNFVEKVIMPLWKRFDKVDKGAPPKILYEEIPFLFKPGELAYVPAPPTTSKALHRSALQTIFKMAYCIPRDLSHEFRDGSGWKKRSQDTFWMLYCLDYDGDRFKAVYSKAEFASFDGEKEITSLPCFPLRFHPHYDVLLKHQTDMGIRFRDCVEGGVRHQYYSGWTLVTGMFPETDDEKKSKQEDPEHIESEVVVDFKEAARHIPEWPPNEEPIWHGSWKEETDMACPMTYWSKDGTNQQIYEGADTIIIREDNIHCKYAEAYFEDDKWVHEKEDTPDEEWKPVDLAILPKRVLGYVLRERKFARLDIQNFQIKKEDRQVTLDDIKMKPSHRSIIRSTVSSHFDKKEKERTSDVPVYNPDLIQGKGRGLVILLHGAPGVGKTATAEAVALENKKPLFPITCGDLGVKPDSVESTLKEIFRYAHLWDCILLLDEADVFLTQRDRTDIERNALVSVFLRVLEYYSGILFLTTNRVGALDEAFRSRVHISLYYPHLSCSDTLAILKDNLDRLPRVEKAGDNEKPGPGHVQVMDQEIHDFIETEFKSHYKKHKRGPWNGRQIRNAVQIASCLAFYERQSHPKIKTLPAVLTKKHFETVAETTAEFDRYLKQARRADEAKLAHMQGDRYDEFDDQHAQGHEPIQFEPSFADRRERGGGSRGQANRRPIEPQSSSRMSSRNVRSGTPQFLSPRGYEDDYGRGSGRSSDRRRQNYRPQTPEDDHDPSEDGEDMDMRHGSSSHEMRSGGRGQVNPPNRRANAPPQRGAVDSHDEDDLNRHSDDDDGHQDWDDSQHGRELPKSAPRSGFAMGRSPASGTKGKSYIQDDTPTRSRRQDPMLDRDEYVTSGHGRNRRF
ncbi:Fidgetin-like protein 1 [Pleurostoma richardsiae]|uniref:Fidgetin-like protein 1 n=1 Tax=Pleurostoma richardsiae TaxID=41990 RepID=A0AA38VIU0_9PEZI|nr:Fidgetin-like protein 1 [Pleurostoma richardsiae]